MRFRKGLIPQLQNKIDATLFSTVRGIVASATSFETTYDRLKPVLGKRNDISHHQGTQEQASSNRPQQSGQS